VEQWTALDFRLFQSPISNALKNKKPGFQAFLFFGGGGGNRTAAVSA
jgi:hypothetical protein